MSTKVLAVWGILLLAIAIQGVPTLAADRLSHSSVDTKISARAKEWFVRFQTGRIDRGQLGSDVNSQLTSDKIQQEKATLQVYGKPQAFKFLGSQRVPGGTGYSFLLAFANGRVIESIAFDKNGKIIGIDFATFVPNGE